MIERLVKIINMLWNVMSRAGDLRDTIEGLILFSNPSNVRNESVYEHKQRLLSFYVKFVGFVDELDDVKAMLEQTREIAEDDEDRLKKQTLRVPPPEATFIVNGKNVGTKLGAIKAIRKLRPTWGLKETKDFIEKFALQQYSVDLSE